MAKLHNMVAEHHIGHHTKIMNRVATCGEETPRDAGDMLRQNPVAMHGN